MDRQYIRDNAVVERYLQGRLTPAEEQAFEEAYLGDAALLEELEVATRLREGIKDSGAAGLAVAPRKPSRWLALAGSPGYALAASLVAAVGLTAAGALYVENGSLRSGGTASVAASAMRVLPLVSVRGSSAANVIFVPRADEWTALLLDTGFSDYDRYRAVLLRRSDGAEILRIDDLTSTYEGFVALGLPATAFVPGEYEIRLEGGRRDWPAEQAFDELSVTPLTVALR
jgi:hypothetical protein